jgi:outer membrane protein assembly factor BamB
VVSLLDGKIAALDAESGRRLWEYDTGQPLVSNKGTASRGNDSLATVFPGADGSLYAYHHKERSFEASQLGLRLHVVGQRLAVAHDEQPALLKLAC